MKEATMEQETEEQEEIPQYDWIEYAHKPLKDGIHDSGYRFLRVTGVQRQQGSSLVLKTLLHDWADHITFEGAPINMDVTRDGIHRIAPWGHPGRWQVMGGFRGVGGSDAMFEWTPRRD